MRPRLLLGEFFFGGISRRISVVLAIRRFEDGEKGTGPFIRSVDQSSCQLSFERPVETWSPTFPIEALVGSLLFEKPGNFARLKTCWMKLSARFQFGFATLRHARLLVLRFDQDDGDLGGFMLRLTVTRGTRVQKDRGLVGEGDIY